MGAGWLPAAPVTQTLPENGDQVPALADEPVAP